MNDEMTKLQLKLLKGISKGRNLCILQLCREDGLFPLTAYRSRDYLMGRNFIRMEPKEGTRTQLVAKITKQGIEYLNNLK